MITINAILECKDYPNSKANETMREIESLNALLELMENDRQYQCKEFVGKIKNCWTPQAIGVLMKRLRLLNLVECIKVKGSPIEVECLVRDSITVNGVVYNSEGYWGTKTITPIITYYRKKQ